MKSAAGLVWSLVAVVGLVGLQAPEAHAGATCSLVPSWCPPAPGGGGGGSSTVPEPATLTVLALGAAAAGIASRRRPRK